MDAVVVDAKGLSCPLPVVRARLAIDKLARGAEIRVLATDPGSVADFASWTKMSGHQLLESAQDGEVFTYLIRKGA
jgi:tRNA 2-thiouridine synthesizing protein A